MTAQAIDPKAIKPRKVRLAFDDVNTRYFYDDNSVISTFFAALSATFPPGEKEFINSVRNFQDQVKDPALQEAIKGFIGQEGQHSHQHKSINETLDNVGLHATKLEKMLDDKIKKDIVGMSDADRLALTVCMEHITAILAEFLLTNQDILDPAPKSIKDLMLWHAIEEIEHKAVAFDVYELTGGDKNRLRVLMAIQTLEFTRLILSYQIMLLWWNKKVPKLRDFTQMAGFLFGKKGMFTKVGKSYLDFFRKDFHPWKHDNQHLVDQWKTQYQDLEFA